MAVNKKNFTGINRLTEIFGYIKTKLDALSARIKQPDWNQNDATADDYIKNKPTIPAAQVNSDWNATSGKAQILNKPNVMRRLDRIDSDDYLPNSDGVPAGWGTFDSESLPGQCIDDDGVYLWLPYSSSNGTTGILIFADDVESPATGLWYRIGDQSKTPEGDYKYRRVYDDDYHPAAKVSGVKGNAESSYRTGNVNLTPANIGAAASSHTHNYAGSSSAGGDANNALKLNGYTSDTAKTANTIVRRDGNGYIYAAYYNQSSGAETPTTSSYIIYANSDGWFRKSTLANIKNVMGAATASWTYRGLVNYNSTSLTISTSGVNEFLVISTDVKDRSFIIPAHFLTQKSFTGLDQGESDAFELYKSGSNYIIKNVGDGTTQRIYTR